MTLIPFSSSAFISTDDSQLHRRFGPKIQACDLLSGNRPQVADAAVGKIDQVTVTVDIASLDEPRLAAVDAARSAYHRTASRRNRPVRFPVSCNEAANPSVNPKVQRNAVLIAFELFRRRHPFAAG